MIQKRLIIKYDYAINNQSDIKFGYSAIEEMREQESPTTVVADGAYDSDDTRALAEKNKVQFVTTQLKGQPPNPQYADIILDAASKEVLQCPGGLRWPLTSDDS